MTMADTPLSDDDDLYLRRCVPVLTGLHRAGFT